MQRLFNGAGAGGLARPFDHLVTEYEHLRTQYEVLREDYEALRRPFNGKAGLPHTDIWTHPPVHGATTNKHPAQKPVAMMRDMIELSTRPDDITLDHPINPKKAGGNMLQFKKDRQNEWRWQVSDSENHEPLAKSTEGFDTLADAGADAFQTLAELFRAYFAGADAFLALGELLRAACGTPPALGPDAGGARMIDGANVVGGEG